MVDVSSLVLRGYQHCPLRNTCEDLGRDRTHLLRPSRTSSSPSSGPVEGKRPDSVYCHIPTALFLPFPLSLALIYAMYSLLIFSVTDINLGVAKSEGFSVDIDVFEQLDSELSGWDVEGRVCRTNDRSGFSCSQVSSEHL